MFLHRSKMWQSTYDNKSQLHILHILHRLANWFEVHGIICDEQNGFRSGRSTIDHICSMSYIVETKLKKKQEMHVAFIDFSKAYDKIDRTLL